MRLSDLVTSRQQRLHSPVVALGSWHCPAGLQSSLTPLFDVSCTIRVNSEHVLVVIALTSHNLWVKTRPRERLEQAPCIRPWALHSIHWTPHARRKTALPVADSSCRGLLQGAARLPVVDRPATMPISPLALCAAAAAAAAALAAARLCSRPGNVALQISAPLPNQVFIRPTTQAASSNENACLGGHLASLALPHVTPRRVNIQGSAILALVPLPAGTGIP